MMLRPCFYFFINEFKPNKHLKKHQCDKNLFWFFPLPNMEGEQPSSSQISVGKY